MSKTAKKIFICLITSSAVLVFHATRSVCHVILNLAKILSKKAFIEFIELSTESTEPPFYMAAG